MIPVYQVPGTLHGMDTMTGQSCGGDPSKSWLAKGIDTTKFHYVYVDYPAWVVPMGPSIDQGVKNLLAAIDATPGPFVAAGTSQGAAVVSRAISQLGPREADMLAICCFGNPLRMQGHTFPGCPDPGGHGIDANCMTSVPDCMWDFAITGDVAACQYAPPFTQEQSYWMTEAWEVGQTNRVLTLDALVAALTQNHDNVLENMVYIAEAFAKIVTDVGADKPHGLWWEYAPLPGDPRSCYRIALDYINGLA